ncbi:family 43 glycosylhydrolase [Pelagicoccus enzymogenes]|uniref:family 43 glycosylhydrolase n=1 Tax=Pelagicoccus enzymogenes TaxID=2773457 RepID=UPI00280D2F69|nr:family 43 glycosylhydrolase [Pelagicoccus enzymogenes]MDQ8200148.1 family 43 glycosylhydrolase [Pelagicoccus enzymogenes]
MMNSIPTLPITLEQLQRYGVTDPQVRIYQDTAYLYASHDEHPDNTEFVMPDWQVWSSKDLVNWQYEATLSPEDTYIGAPFKGCWAGDSIYKNGIYYWCFSAVDKSTDKHEIGLVSAPSPTGPWTDPIGEAWIPHDSAPTHVYDPGFLQEEDGTTYIVFGVWDYYIARLEGDMSGLAETPRKLEILDPRGPYGEGTTDDKPFLHKHGNLYYLSWGAFYATSENLYGPYQYRGCLIDEKLMDSSFAEKTWPHGPQQGRHGSFFDWNGQSYFMYCDMSFSGNRYYRGSWISYVHYRENGEIAPIEITSEAVGRYTAGKPIPAANFSDGNGIQKVENPDGRLSIAPIERGARVSYPNIRDISTPSVDVILRFSKSSDSQTIKISNGHHHCGEAIPINATEVHYRIDAFVPHDGITLQFCEVKTESIQLDYLTVAEH